MEFIFLINVLVTFLIFMLCSLIFFRHTKNQALTKVNHRIVLLGFGYLILFVIFLFWFIEVFVFITFEYVWIHALVVFAQTVLLFFIFRFFISGKHLWHLLFFYLVGLFSLFFSFASFVFVVLLLSFFLTLILSIVFLSQLSIHRRAGYFLLAYAVFSLLVHFLFLVGIDHYHFLTTVSHVIFLLFVYFFLRDLRHYPLRLHSKKFRDHNYLISFLRYFVFIAVLVSLALIATVGVHEFGHVLFAKFADCEYQTIIFEEGSSPYTQVFCDDDSLLSLALLAGPLLPILLSLILFAVGSAFIRDISFLILGFNLIASYKDLVELQTPLSLVVTLLLIGLIFLFLGIVFLSRTRIDEHHLIRSF